VGKGGVVTLSEVSQFSVCEISAAMNDCDAPNWRGGNRDFGPVKCSIRGIEPKNSS
jgi:hypothetical protein